MTLRLAATAIALAVPAFALAQDAATFAPRGVYLFHTDEQQNGQPLCMELWEFGDDGRMRVESGQERVTKAYRIVTDRDGAWIVTRTLETNGQPDCMGNSSPTVSPEEGRTYVVPMNDGRVLTCPPPGRAPNGAPYVSGCYGSIIPGDMAG